MGYFDGRQSAKVWLVSAKDLKVMYEKANSSCEISLWVQTCEDIDAEEDSDINPEPSRKKGKQLSKERINLRRYMASLRISMTNRPTIHHN